MQPRKSAASFLKNPTLNSRLFKLLFVTVNVAFILLAILAFQPRLQAQTNEDLAEQFAPVLHFTSGEKFYPISVDYLISSSSLKQRSSDGDPTLIDPSPTPENLGTYTGDNLFLDNNFGTFESIADDYSSIAESIGYFAYVHVVNNGDTIVIQYWLFYVFNNGPLNDHQGDIEVVQVFLDSAGNPLTILLSQHGAGQNAAWGDVEKAEEHPVVYVAEGSHANYFRPYQGKIGIENDVVGSDGKTITPGELFLEFLGEQGNHPASQSWLDFPGRWGYWGTDEEAALGRAGPYGPVFNQNGVRWSEPLNYLASTVNVDGTYFLLAWFTAYFLLLFIIYIVARGSWKGWHIFKLHRRGGLLLKKFVKGRGAMGLMVGIAAIVLTVVALFLPWYTITASSEFGPLAETNGAPLMTMDGIHGVNVNMFLSAEGSDSTSGYANLFSTQLPFAIFLGAGIVLLVLDIIGVKSGKSLGRKFWYGIIDVLLPVILIIVFVTQLPAFLPYAYGLFPGQGIPVQIEDVARSIAASPVAGTTNTDFPMVGATTVSWGLGIGAYLLIVVAILRFVAGLMMRAVPDLQKANAAQPPLDYVPPPPPPP